MNIAEALANTPVSSVDLSRYIAVTPATSVEETVSLMASAGRSVAFVDNNGALEGVFTQRDFIQRVLGRPHTWTREITEEATTPVKSIRNSDSVGDGLALMNEWWVRSVPVIDEGDSIAGNLSFFTVIATIHNLLSSRLTGSAGTPTVHHGMTLVDFTGLHMDPVVLCDAEDPVEIAVHQMRARGLNSILATDDRENLVGELSEFDLLTKIGCTESDLSKISVAEVMETSPVSLEARSSIAEGLEELMSQKVSHVPLIGESGRPVGVASFLDIANYVETSLETLA